MKPKSKQAGVDIESIRNIGIIAHIDAGKTTITERFLYYTGKTHRIGDIDNGNTVMDYLDEERARGITIVAAAASFHWQPDENDFLIHLIDTPGHIDFTAEVERSIRVCDGAVVIFSGVEGVEAQSEKVWRQSDHYHVPKIAFINKLDRLGASFTRVMDEIRSKFQAVTAVGVQVPIGVESELRGVIDLVRMKALYFDGDDGGEVRVEDIPAELTEAAVEARDDMVAAIADESDAVAEFYLEDSEVPEDVLLGEIRKLVVAGKLCPVFCGAAKKNIGVQPVLDAVCRFLPGPADKRCYQGISVGTGDNIEIEVGDDNFTGLIFKIVAGGSADLLYLRSYTGKLSLNDTVYNPRTREKLKIKRLLRLYSKNIEPIETVGPGDIVGVIGPKDVITGDTLCSVNRPVFLEKIAFPEPVISMAIEPRSSGDKDKLRACLELLCREDPTLNLKVHENTGQLILSGMGELHLEVNCNRIEKEFGVKACYGAPQVAFRETIKEACRITGVFNRTLGDQEFYAEVDIELEPVPRLEAGIEVSVKLKKSGDMLIPASWVQAAEVALNSGLRTGGNWGYPLIYIRGAVTAIRGTQDRASENVVAGAVLDALSKAINLGTLLLEPLMNLDIISPEETIGEITGYLQARRAVIHSIDNLQGVKRLSCEVPMAEMFGFSKALPKLSGGRAGFSMEPCGYQEISERDLAKLVSRDS